MGEELLLYVVFAYLIEQKVQCPCAQRLKARLIPSKSWMFVNELYTLNSLFLVEGRVDSLSEVELDSGDIFILELGFPFG